MALNSSADCLFDINHQDKQKVLNFLSQQNILILGRYDAPTDYLSQFLTNNVKSLTLLKIRPERQHILPLFLIHEYVNGRLVYSKKITHMLAGFISGFGNSVFTLTTYARVIFFLLYFFTRKKHYNVVIGVGPFNSWIGALYKFFNKKAKTVYYCEDNVLADNKNIIGRLTVWCDRQAEKECTMVWFVSSNNMNLHKKNTRLYTKSLYVPEPIMSFRHRGKKKEKIIVFLGGVSEKQGCDLLYNCFKRLTKLHKNIKLRIIGNGYYEPILKKISKKDGLGDKIEFKGFIIERNQILKLISESYIGVAPYNPYLYQNLAFGQSSKLSNYVGCGLPVVLTGSKENMPSMAVFINKYKLGFVSAYNERQVFFCLHRLLKDKKKYLFYQKNTAQMITNFNEKDIYLNAFNHLWQISYA